MNEKDILDKLEKFQCMRCNECCRKPGYVYLSETEAEEIARFLGKEVRAFMDEFCEIVDRRKIVLKKHADEACIFLTETGCSVHPAKPRQCRDFPVKWRTPASFEYCAGLKKLFAEDKI